MTKSFAIVATCILAIGCAKENKNETSVVNDQGRFSLSWLNEVKAEVETSTVSNKPYQSADQTKKSILGHGINAEVSGLGGNVSSNECLSGKQVMNTVVYGMSGFGGTVHRAQELYSDANPYEAFYIQDYKKPEKSAHPEIWNFAKKAIGDNKISTASSVHYRPIMGALTLSIPKLKDSKCEGFKNGIYIVAYGASYVMTQKLTFKEEGQIEKWIAANKEHPLFSVFDSSKMDATDVGKLLENAGVEKIEINLFQIGGNLEAIETVLRAANCSTRNIDGCRSLTSEWSKSVNDQYPTDLTADKMMKNWEPVRVNSVPLKHLRN